LLSVTNRWILVVRKFRHSQVRSQVLEAEWGWWWREAWWRRRGRGKARWWRYGRLLALRRVLFFLIRSRNCVICHDGSPSGYNRTSVRFV
jgi:hypothetical protein